MCVCLPASNEAKSILMYILIVFGKDVVLVVLLLLLPHPTGKPPN